MWKYIDAYMMQVRIIRTFGGVSTSVTEKEKILTHFYRQVIRSAFHRNSVHSLCYIFYIFNNFFLLSNAI